MKRKIGIVSMGAVIILLLLIVFCLYSHITVLMNAENRIIDTGDYYVLQRSDEMYYQVCDENDMFDDEIKARVSHFTSLDNRKSISFCELSKEKTPLSKLFGGILNSGEELEVCENNKEEEIISRFKCSQYFVRKDFSLPKLSPNEIEAIVVVDSTDYNNILEEHTDNADIKNILVNYSAFFQNAENTYNHAYECYIVYKDYDLVEFISSDYLASLQKYIND